MGYIVCGAEKSVLTYRMVSPECSLHYRWFEISTFNLSVRLLEYSTVGIQNGFAKHTPSPNETECYVPKISIEVKSHFALYLIYSHSIIIFIESICINNLKPFSRANLNMYINKFYTANSHVFYLCSTIVSQYLCMSYATHPEYPAPRIIVHRAHPPNQPVQFSNLSSSYMHEIHTHTHTPIKHILRRIRIIRHKARNVRWWEVPTRPQQTPPMSSAPLKISK